MASSYSWLSVASALWSTTEDWSLVSGPADGGFPQPGDTAEINSGTVQIVGANFSVADLSLGGSLTGPTNEDKGTLSVLNGHQLQITAVLALWNSSTLSVDSASDIDLGGSGAAAAGSLLIENGYSLIGDGVVAASVVNDGTIDATNNATPADSTGGELTIDGAVNGTGTINIASGATLQIDGTIGAGQTIDFAAGTPETLILGGPSQTIAATINGFTYGDKIEFANGPYGITYDSGFTNGTTLTIGVENNNEVDYTYSFTDIKEAAGPSSSLNIAFDPATDYAFISPYGQFYWTGDTNSDLGLASNWNDLTDKENPALIAPGPLDEEFFDTSSGGTLSGATQAEGAAFVDGGNWTLASGTSFLTKIELDIYDASLTVGDGSTITSDGYLSVGYPGSGGTLTVSSAGIIQDLSEPAPLDDYALSVGDDGTGTVTVTGAGSKLDLGLNGAEIGNDGGTGTVIVSQGGTFIAGTADSNENNSLAVSRTGDGTLIVTDPGSEVEVTGLAYVAHNETGSLTVENSATFLATLGPDNLGGLVVGAGSASIGEGGLGTVDVTTDGVLDSDGYVIIGDHGTEGEVSVSDGGIIEVGESLVVGDTGSNGAMTVAGEGSLSIGAGGTVEVTRTPVTGSFGITIGNATGGAATPGNGIVTVSGAGALLDANGNGIGVGLLTSGTLTVSQGGTVLAGTPDSTLLSALSIGRDGIGSVTVTGSGSDITADGIAYVGRAGTGDLTVSDDGKMTVGLDPNGVGGLAIGGAPYVTTTDYVGGSGTADVTTGGTIVDKQNLYVGIGGATGLLTMNSGTVDVADQILIGNDFSVAAGETIVTTSGTTTAMSPTVYYGNGTIDVDAGGLLKSDGPNVTGDPSIDVGAAVGSTGTLDVTGAGAVANAGGDRITVGDAGAGMMLVSDGGTAEAGADYTDSEPAAILGNQSGATGALTVTGAGSTFSASGDFVTGEAGAGTLTVENQAVVTAAIFDSANETGGSGTTTVTGADSQLNVAGYLTVGDTASAVLTVAQAGTVTAGAMVAGQSAGSDGTVTVEDSDSLLKVTNGIDVGAAGTGSLTVNGGTVTADGGITAGGSLGGNGTIDIEAGGTVTNDGTYTFAGAGAGSTGTISVAGAGAVLNGTASVIIGNYGTGTATVGNGGIINTESLAVGQLDGSDGTLTIDSDGEVIDSGEAIVGNTAGSNGTLNINAGGTLTETESPQDNNYTLYIGLSGTATASVDGAGATIDLNGNPLAIGYRATANGSLTISDGGQVTTGTPNDNDNPALGVGGYGTGALTITGSGSSLTADGGSYLGRAGTATVLIENDGSLVIGADDNGSSGLQIGFGNPSVPQTGGSGTVTVTTGGILNAGNTLYVGGAGVDGTLDVNDGGVAEFVNRLYVGASELYDGTTYGGTGDIVIGADGTVMATAAAQDSSAAIYIGDNFSGAAGPAGTGTITVSGTGALLDTNGSPLQVGVSGTGTLIVSQGGSVVAGTTNSTNYAALGVGSLGIGSVTVTDAGSHLTANGYIYIGRAGTGTLLVQNDGSVMVGVGTDGSGGLSIGGANTGQRVWQTLYVGGSGTATVTLGGDLYSQQNLDVGSAGASGLLTISDQTTPSNTGTVEVGDRILIGNDSTLQAGGTVTTTSGSHTVDIQTLYYGNGTIDVDAGGLLKSDGPNTTNDPSIDVGAAAGSTGTLNVSGAGAVVNAGGDRITVGDAGAGTMLVSDGGAASAGANYTDTEAAAELGTQAGATGTLTVTDPGSTFTASGAFDIGKAGAGTLTIENQGIVTAASLDAAGTSSGTGAITVTGTNSHLDVAGQFTLGDQALATMSVGLGGTVTAGSLDLGETANGIGSVDLEDADTLLDVTDNLNVGVAGTGVLTVGGGSELTVGGNITVGALGTVIGSGGTIDPQYYDNTGITYGPLSVQATIAIDNTGTFVAEAGTLELNGAVTGTGVLDLEDGGTLQFDQAVAGTQTVRFATASGVLDIKDPTQFAATIEGYVAGDIVGVYGIGGLAAPSYTYDAADGYTTLRWTNGTSINLAGDVASGSVETQSDGDPPPPPPTCFLDGTRIATLRGAVAVQDLRIGDRVRTASGGMRPIVWIGWRRLDPTRHPQPQTVLPVRIRRDAFGRGAPRRALYLSPDHAVFVDDVLIPVKYLINGTTIRQMPAKGEITYFHIELDRHDVLLAEGLPAESYLETGCRANFQNGGAPVVQHPDFGERVWEALGCAPLVTIGPKLDAAQIVVGRISAAPPATFADRRKTAEGAAFFRPATSECNRLLSAI